ncbi:MAG: hypothetical protein U1F49_11415 [Rubrivivax sp.]
MSRIATATGINRREVTRLTAAAAPAAGGAGCFTLIVRAPSRSPSRLSPARSARALEHARRLARRGRPAARCRAWARRRASRRWRRRRRATCTRAACSTSCAAWLARLDAATDTVALQGDAFVPSGDRVRMLGFLGDNVGDHLRAAVDNVLAAGKPPHLEQASTRRG